MSKLTVEGAGQFEVPQGKRLVLALEDEAKIDQLHACGGYARCTTCRVQFLSGEPEQMTEAEKAVLGLRGGHVPKRAKNRCGGGTARPASASAARRSNDTPRMRLRAPAGEKISSNPTPGTAPR